MIITEHYRTREDGVVLNRTYSDRCMMIEREGVRYCEAIDPVDSNRQYTETDELINKDVNPYEVTEADYKKALRDMGVDV